MLYLVPVLDNIPSEDGYILDQSIKDITIDTTSLSDLESIGANACIILTKRVLIDNKVPIFAFSPFSPKILPIFAIYLLGEALQ